MIFIITQLSKNGNKAELLFTDTDSFCCDIKTSNLANARKTNIDKYDTSNYPKYHDFIS